jgi:hypothetical protein
MRGVLLAALVAAGGNASGLKSLLQAVK